MELYQGRRQMPAHMRHRLEVDLSKTDRELFEKLPLGDCWVDGQLQSVWKYLWQSKYVTIPNSWIGAMRKFDQELTKTVPCSKWWP